VSAGSKRYIRGGLWDALVVVKPMGSAVAMQPGGIARVELSGAEERVPWKQHGAAFTELPKNYRRKSIVRLPSQAVLGGQPSDVPRQR